MLRLITGGIVAGREEEPVTISAASDSPDMTPALAKVFAGIFHRLLSEEHAGLVAAKEGTAA